MDAGFISATLTTVTKKSKRSTLACTRALLRLESPELVRIIAANQFVEQLVRTGENESLPYHVRERAALARHELTAVPLLLCLVTDLKRPWKLR